MPDLSGKVALVTGCASGIGAATVKRLLDNGAVVLGTDIDVRGGMNVCEATGAAFVEQDVADTGLWRKIVCDLVEDRGRFDILVNNAGVISGQSIEDVTDEVWGRTYDINITGTMAGCRAALAAMKGNPGGPSGSIINIASTTALAPLPSDVAYSSSKAAVIALTRSIATYCAGQGYTIRCNAVIPGATDTGILAQAEDLTPGFKQAVAATSPLNRLADPAETAAAIAFLASDECPYMTGTELLVDGGMLSRHPGF